ncbi:MAG TPA: ZIP family metal transporter [Candidatus Woesebacteria bacterium]|nr:ZIP family metal transporter [Candidatus Woesebacteria bacterium]
MSILLQIILGCLIGGIASLIGALMMIGLKKRSGKLSDKLTSFAAGVLITIAIVDLIPEAFEAVPDMRAGSWSILFGVLLVFLMEKTGLWFHHHDGTHGNTPSIRGIFWGDALHNFIDGMAIGAAFLLDTKMGILTAMAVGLHELPKEMADFSVYLRSGCSDIKNIFLNLISSLVAVGGGIAVYANRTAMMNYEGYLLATTAGMFLFIALADLVPEMHENMSRVGWKDKLVWLLIFATGLAVGILSTLGLE